MSHLLVSWQNWMGSFATGKNGAWLAPLSTIHGILKPKMPGMECHHSAETDIVPWTVACIVIDHWESIKVGEQKSDVGDRWTHTWGGYFSYENSRLSLISHFSGSDSTSFLFPISSLPTSRFPLLISHFPHLISHFSFLVSHFMW